MPEPQSSFQERSLEEPPIYQVYEAVTAYLRKRLASQERRQRTEYQLFSIVYNLLSIAQIIIGAAITALGPSGGDHMLAITILGAFNTSIAGLLALLKGRGLPQRLRRNMAELAKVLDHIEEQTILLRYGSNQNSKDGIDSLIEDAVKRYVIAQDIIEKNQTDTYADGNLSQNPTSTAEADCSQIHRTTKSNKNGKQRVTDKEMGANEMNHL